MRLNEPSHLQASGLWASIMPLGQTNSAELDAIARAGSGAESERRADGDLPGFGQGTARLKERVALHFEQWRDPVYRYLVAVFGAAAQADEITQEAFLKLYETLQSGQEVVNVRAWVFRVAHNLAVDQVRGRQFIEPLDEAAWEEARRSMRDTGPSPEQRMMQIEKLGRLNAAIARLTMVERQCLHLRASGLRYREVAEIVGMSTTSVAETLYRVIQKLGNETQG
jgi:RNA polymerase sigma-70 factor (ECF subfamily)